MQTPFDKVVANIASVGYHNHRRDDHSDTVSRGLFDDLVSQCAPLKQDLEVGIVRAWFNVSSPGDRLRKVDLFVGEPGPQGAPDVPKVRIAVENKSVLTAHRNATNRFDDLRKVLGAIHAARPEALIVATVMVGLAERVLNVPDQLHKFYREEKEQEFKRTVLPRLSSGDAKLWSDFPWAVSTNKPYQAAKSIALFRTLPTRKPGHTHVEGFDWVLLVPMTIDNVNPPIVCRTNSLDIDVDREYRKMLEQLCAAYTARWHM